MSRTALGAFTLALVLAALVTGCGGTSGGGAIDRSALEGQLARVIRLQLTAGFFFERDVYVSCVETRADGLAFSCRIVATNPREQPQRWILTVACRRDAPRDAPRCFSSGGDALQ